MIRTEEKKMSNIEHRISREEVDPRLRGDDKKERRKMSAINQLQITSNQ